MLFSTNPTFRQFFSINVTKRKFEKCERFTFQQFSSHLCFQDHFRRKKLEYAENCNSWHFRKVKTKRKLKNKPSNTLKLRLSYLNAALLGKSMVTNHPRNYDFPNCKRKRHSFQNMKLKSSMGIFLSQRATSILLGYLWLYNICFFFWHHSIGLTTCSISWQFFFKYPKT